MGRILMKILIVYATKHGCTEKCVNKLKNRLTGEIELLNLKKSAKIDLNNYETVIIGGSIHAGQIQKSVKRFCLNYLNLLKEKKIGIFICCMEEGEKAADQFNRAFPEELIKQASATGIFGGEFNFEKMNFIERFIVRKIAKVDKSVSKIYEENITKFVSQIN
jgi:menaquinone-dependent protoporphyrinogen oxidase